MCPRNIITGPCPAALAYTGCRPIASFLPAILSLHCSRHQLERMGVAAYWAAVAAKPKEKITLRQGARVIMKNWEN